MLRKRILIGIVLVGFVLALGSNVWAGHGKHGKRHHHDKVCHRCHKAHHGHHYGWAKEKRYHHRHLYRYHRAQRHRYHHRPVVVEKHIYHEYQTAEPEPAVEENNGFRFAFSVADEAVGITVEVSETY